MHDRLTGPRNAVRLPFPEPPPIGSVIEVAPGLLWSRLPLPMRLDHVNVWLVEERDGWTAVDAGLDTPAARAAWEALERGPLGGRPIRRLVVTHGHVDHIGLAGWLTARHEAAFQTTRTAWLWGRVGHLNSGQPTSSSALAFLRSHGIDEARVAAFGADRGLHAKLFAAQPTSFERIDDGSTVRMGGREWLAMLANGHGDDHASFVDTAGRVLIAGDQILQRISPVVGVFSTEPLADPLSEYLGSLPRFTALCEDMLVLPSHGLPFYGLHKRVAELAHHHEVRLAKTIEALKRPTSAADCAHALFEARTIESQWLLTLAETLAHLHRLVALGQARRQQTADGSILFERT
jgi:glyoxylase-like metal-dependent hydrolase (beta-lactamase superfamily II)